jgi:undecaprenyl-diphosphatase
MSPAFDIDGFRALNGLAGRSEIGDAAIIFGATYLIFVLAALVAFYVLACRRFHVSDRCGTSFSAFVAVPIGLVMERLIGLVYFRARPFVDLTGVIKLADRLPAEKSFPSAHATAAFAMAFAIYIQDRRWGAALLLLAALVALSRVAAGVHYPTDIMAGAVVGFLAAEAASHLQPRLSRWSRLLSDLVHYRKTSS